MAKRITLGFAALTANVLVLSDSADFLYLATDFYAPQHERAIAWNDPALGIQWPLAGEPILSDKDRTAPMLREADLYD